MKRFHILGNLENSYRDSMSSSLDGCPASSALQWWYLTRSGGGDHETLKPSKPLVTWQKGMSPAARPARNLPCPSTKACPLSLFPPPAPLPPHTIPPTHIQEHSHLLSPSHLLLYPLPSHFHPPTPPPHSSLIPRHPAHHQVPLLNFGKCWSGTGDRSVSCPRFLPAA